LLGLKGGRAWGVGHVAVTPNKRAPGGQPPGHIIRRLTLQSIGGCVLVVVVPVCRLLQVILRIEREQQVALEAERGTRAELEAVAAAQAAELAELRAVAAAAAAVGGGGGGSGVAAGHHHHHHHHLSTAAAAGHHHHTQQAAPAEAEVMMAVPVPVPVPAPTQGMQASDSGLQAAASAPQGLESARGGGTGVGGSGGDSSCRGSSAGAGDEGSKVAPGVARMLTLAFRTPAGLYVKLDAAETDAVAEVKARAAKLLGVGLPHNHSLTCRFRELDDDLSIGSCSIGTQPILRLVPRRHALTPSSLRESFSGGAK
jgi:hypothetical protein